MMSIHIFSEYKNLVEAGRAKALTCPMHEDKIYDLNPSLTNEDKIMLQCFSCSYKVIVGQTLYENIKRVVENESITK